MMYTRRPPKRQLPRRLLVVAGVLILVVVGGALVARHEYFVNLQPVSAVGGRTKLITVASGSSVDAIAKQLQQAGLIRSAWAFKLYVSSKDVRQYLEAGTYSFSANQSVPQIVSQLTHGKVATDLVTIIPGEQLRQVRQALLNYGYSAADVDRALNPATYANNPALVDKPAGASLEGYIYPDSYQKTANTKPQQLIQNALQEMDKQLTPDLRNAFAAQGLSTYQAIILASIIEEEVNTPADRAQAAQVFLLRLSQGMPLGSDVTAYYGSQLAGQGNSLTYDTPYNTHLHTGLPPTPISNVDISALLAVAHPAAGDYLYFVTGDDGVTHFSHTLEEHQAAVDQYCHKLCSQ